MGEEPTAVVGVVLAAGAGRRYGFPKALARTPAGTSWAERAVDVLRDAGCGRVLVVVGAAADQVAELVTGRAEVVTATAWETGMHASLTAGLEAAEESGADAAVVMLVDLPDVDAAVVRRVLAEADPSPDVLARAAYRGRAGHPVVIGRHHFAGIRGSGAADAGARDYLRANPVHLVECGDLATGHDVDHR